VNVLGLRAYAFLGMNYDVMDYGYICVVVRVRTTWRFSGRDSGARNTVVAPLSKDPNSRHGH